MTYSEDVKRTATPDTIDYLNARVEALEKEVKILAEKVEFLEATIEIKNN